MNRIILALGTMATAATLFAVQFIPMSIEELTRQADLVVRGQVASRTVQRDASGRIFTQIEFKVQEVWKGKVDEPRITLVHGGGVLGQERAGVSGQADYPVGEEAVVFAIRNARGQAVTLGLRQGKFKIWAEPKTGEKVAANGFAHAPANNEAKARSLIATQVREALPLVVLKDRVKATLP